MMRFYINNEYVLLSTAHKMIYHCLLHKSKKILPFVYSYYKREFNFTRGISKKNKVHVVSYSL